MRSWRIRRRPLQRGRIEYVDPGLLAENLVGDVSADNHLHGIHGKRGESVLPRLRMSVEMASTHHLIA